MPPAQPSHRVCNCSSIVQQQQLRAMLLLLPRVASWRPVCPNPQPTRLPHAMAIPCCAVRCRCSWILPPGYCMLHAPTVAPPPAACHVRMKLLMVARTAACTFPTTLHAKVPTRAHFDPATLLSICLLCMYCSSPAAATYSSLLPACTPTPASPPRACSIA